jgi:hypothetical protein
VQVSARRPAILTEVDVVLSFPVASAGIVL